MKNTLRVIIDMDKLTEEIEKELEEINKRLAECTRRIAYLRGLLIGAKKD